MEEPQKFFEPTPVDRDATLATPRFDEVEAQVARPVVPLAGSPAGKRPRRQWPIALVLVSALAGGVVSLFAFRLYQQRQQPQVAATETGKQTPETDSTPAPTPAVETGAIVTTAEQAQSENPSVIEEFEPASERSETSDAQPARKAAEEEAKPTARDERKDEAKPVARVVETRARRVESSPAPRQVEVRDDDNARRDERTDEDVVERRRERRRQRREERREQRAEPKRNIDRIKDIFEGAPPR